ncbi:MAG TPA: sensor histidine kinase [Streptosporangiaceae bacterium]
MKRLAARVAAFPPRLQDLVLALGLAAVNVAITLPYRHRLQALPGAPELVRQHPQAAAIALLAAQALPLIWRRSWPVVVFLAVGLARSRYDQLGFGDAPIPLGPAIAYYTVMERCSTGVRWALSVVLLAGILISQSLPGHNEPYDFFVAALIFVAAGMAGILSRTRSAYLGEVEKRAARAEAERDQEAALAAARERTRIARELHDVVAHHVSLMAVQAEAAGALLPGRPAEAGQSVQVIGETARQALVELRRLLGVLRGPGEQPGASPSPSLGDLDDVLAQVRGAGLAVDLTIDGSRGDLAPGVDLTAFRIVQEALTNALRHSAAPRAAVRVCYEPGYVTVSVTDSGAPVAGGDGQSLANGRSRADGQSRAAGKLPGGFGLAGIAERVASCGGTLTVGPTGAGGFAVTARLPSS